jgi:nitronate monooxygenase
MYTVSGPELVIAACSAGVAGTFPALNARPAAQLDAWLEQIGQALETRRREHPAEPCAPHGVNLILHPANPRRQQDLETVVRHKVPFVITSLGHPGEVVQAVQAYGGLVFSDVIHAHHARKAMAAGVDGIIAVAAGAGGHAGGQSLVSLVREIRTFWDGVLVAGGCISDGAAIRAVEVLGADFAYMGTRFIATREALAAEAYKQMVVDCGAADVIYTAAVSGTRANFLAPSLQQAGFDPQALAQGSTDSAPTDIRAWVDVWSAGQGVATIDDIPSVAELVARLEAGYRAACALPPSAALASGA